MTSSGSGSGCWQCIKCVFTKPFKSSSYKVRKTHSDPLEVEFSHRPRFNPHSPNSQSQSSQSQTAGRADRYSAGLATNVSSTSSFDAASYEQEYEASIKKTEFMFYCGCDTPKSENGREGGGGAFSFSSSTAPSEYSEDEELASEQRASHVATPKISHQIPVFFSPRNAVPMLPRPKPREKPRPMRMASTRAPSFINVNPIKGRGTDAL